MKRSFKIFFRYVLVSLLIAAIDYSVFWGSQFFISNLFLRLLLARGLSIIVQYLMVNFKVFESRLPSIRTLPFFILVVLLNGFIVSKIIPLLTGYGLTQIEAKIVSEIALYLPNYFILKELVFRKKDSPESNNRMEQ